MKNSTTQANVRSGPRGDAATVGNSGSVVLALPLSFLSTAATADLGITLPTGAIPLGFQHDGGATGGASPTFDMGTAATSDLFIAEGDADLAAHVGLNGAGANVAMTAPTAIYAGVGASAPTGGTITGMFLYIMEDAELGLNE